MTTTDARWTLDELVQRVAAALAEPTYPGAPNGRVRDLPDRRAVRWYVTIGLVDRPAAMQGRTALYGVRHLLQIVAVKRRQAEGRTLAEIQAELSGATNATLRRVAAVPDRLIAEEPEPQQVSLSRRQLRPVPAPAMAPTADERRGEGSRREHRSRFWADPPAAAAAPPAADTPPPALPDSVTMLAGVRLPGGALILLPARPDRPARPDDDDISAIHAAARPLLDLLADRGLLNPEEWST